MRGEGRIFKRGTVWWIAYNRGGQEFRESSESEKPSAAKKLLRERQGEIHSGKFVGPIQERVLLAELLDDLERDYKLNGRRNLPTLKCHVKKLKETFGFDKAKDVTEVRIEKYKEARIEAKAAAATVNRELSALARAFRLAYERKTVSSVPIIKKLREAAPRQGFVEPADFEAVAAELPEYLADFVRFSFLTGWRKGEVSTLTWDDVDLPGRSVRLRPEQSKNSEGRLVKLAGDLLALLEKRDKLRLFKTKDGTEHSSPLVFHDGQGAELYDFRKAWETAAEKAGRPNLLVHDFRRSAVRNLVRAGVPETVAMKVTGHKTRAVFDRYDITSEKDLDDAAQAMQRYLDDQDAAPKVTPAAKARDGKKSSA